MILVELQTTMGEPGTVLKHRPGPTATSLPEVTLPDPTLEGAARPVNSAPRKSRPEYVVWLSMRQRCTDPNDGDFPDYGGRGIKVCERWLNSFGAFLDDMGPRPEGDRNRRRAEFSIEREDVNGNYEPSNCRWATQTEQCRNRRNNRIVEAFGESLCLAEWEERTGVRHSTIAQRLASGRTPEEAVSKPPQKLELKGVRPGQVWRNCDPRNPYTVRVETVEDGRVFGRSSAGRRIRRKASAFKTGWFELLSEV